MNSLVHVYKPGVISIIIMLMIPKKPDYSLLSIGEVTKRLGVKSITDGLDVSEVIKRSKKFGKNEVVIRHPWQWLKTLIEPFSNWFVMILFASAIISIGIGKLIESIVIVAILLVNAVIYYSQNISANRVMKSLEKQGQLSCLVRRNGKISKIKTTDLVPGDIVVLKEGAKIPADGRLVISNNLHIDESILTGENEPQHKNTDDLDTVVAIYNQTNMAFMGTFVSEGDGEMLVTAIGLSTEYGRITKLSQKHQSKSPLQNKIDNLTRKLILMVFVIALCTFALKLYRGIDPFEALRFILSLIVSAIPEGLPIAVVIVLVFGVKNMAKKNALVRNLSAVETLGQVTLIATDKTGTITKNKLHIAQTWSPSSKTDMITATFKSSIHDEGKGDEIDDLIYSEYLDKSKINGKMQHRLPFIQKKRMSGAVWKYKNTYTTYIKGSAEAVMDICNLSSNAKDIIYKQTEKMASEGMRVLAIAAKNEKVQDLKRTELKGYSFGGLVAFGDELRPRVIEAVKTAHNAGIDVILLTGDHKEAAGYFARLSGISKDQSAQLGNIIADSDNAQIRRLIKNHKVFGRVLPEHKFKILDALHRTHITSMTGDGINDVPALRMANVGIAVGSGNDAAKEASDVVVLDNNFATIVDAISQGRVIVRNVKKMLTYVLATNLGEIFTIVGALVLGLPLPITALQILWINFVTDSFTMIPLGFEKPENNLMEEPPANPNSPIVGKKRLLRIVLMALVMAAITLIVYYFSLPSGIGSAQAIAFGALVVAQWANSINSRSDNRSFVEGFSRTNWLLFGGILIAFLLQMLAMYTNLSRYLNTQSLGVKQLLIVAGVFVVILFTGDILKKLIPIKHVN